MVVARGARPLIGDELSGAGKKGWGEMNIQLADRLFVPDERWGFEFREPDPIGVNPHIDQKPVWQEPPLPDELADLLQEQKEAQENRSARIIWLLLILVGSGIFPPLLMVLLYVATRWFIRPLLHKRRIDLLQQDHQQRRNAALAQFQADMRDWERAVAAYDEAERRRWETAVSWYPVRLDSTPSRVDVFGGTTEGWASLLATVGASLLCADQDVVLLTSPSTTWVGDWAALTEARGIPVHRVALPSELRRIGLLATTGPDECAELLAEAVYGLRQSTNHADARALHADLLGAVIQRLSGQQLSFPRIAAGVKVLQGVYEPCDDGPLHSAEVERLTTYRDTVDRSEYTRRSSAF